MISILLEESSCVPFGGFLYFNHYRKHLFSVNLCLCVCACARVRSFSNVLELFTCDLTLVILLSPVMKHLQVSKQAQRTPKMPQFNPELLFFY